MAENEHPCSGGITPACFEAYPEWAKLAFCYKLLHAIFPANITRRLPKGLFPGRIGPGAVLPPRWVPPPGVIVPPNYTVPQRWIPFTYFILPPGLTWEQIFPPGWTAGDDLPDGVSINANVVDVAGWAEGDPMPSGPDVNTAAILPANWTPTNAPPNWFAPGGSGFAIPPGGVLPPLYLPPQQSPPHRPAPTPPAGFPEITGFWFKVTRGDGTVITDSAELDGYFDVFKSNEDWIASTTFTYYAIFEHWAVEIDPADVDENGYFVFIDYEDGIETQYPFRYKDDDQWDPADLIQFGTYEADVPYWIVSGQTNDPFYNFESTDFPEDTFFWDATLLLPAGWGSVRVDAGFIREGYYYLIDETVGPIKKSRTVKSSIPYSVEYRSIARSTFPTGTRWTFYVYEITGVAYFDNAFSYTITIGGVETVITDGVGVLTNTEYEASISGREHSIYLEVTPRVGGCKYLALRLGDGCSVTPSYD